ncbi:MAG: SAM-dependent methyltransferase [Castellaniella sp.]
MKTSHSGLPAGLPPPDPEALQHSEQLAATLRRRIAASPGASLPFDIWMEAALYAPGMGYYTAGSHKLSAARNEGDFTTAPELSPLFAQTLARQVAQILDQCEGRPQILEFGAGTGRLAAGLMATLQQDGIDAQYAILELSPELQARQRRQLAHLGERVQWLNTLPDAFEGCVIANEVLDAMPVQIVQWDDDGNPAELHVGLDGEAFVECLRPAPPALQAVARERMAALPGYRSEINLRAEAWMRDLGRRLTRGAALIIDYGFPRHEYYHPQRAQGTLMCHSQHHSHADPLVLVGLQDITAHVDFTAMADAALESGLDVLGYTAQARFLLDAGLPALLQAGSAMPDARTLSGVQTLLSEAEMGELFKVLAVGRAIDGPLIGFVSGDRRHRL